MEENIRVRRKSGSAISNMRVDEAVYYVAFALYFIVCVFDHTTYEEFLFIPVALLQSALQAFVLVLLVFKFVSQRASFKGWIIAAAIVLVGFISWRRSGEGWLFWCALFIVCSHDVKLRPLASCALWITLIALLITIPFAQLGLIENIVLTRSAGTVRYAMGFTHPNSLGLYLLVACFSFSILRFGKNPIPDLALIAVADAINLAVADSRTCVLLSMVQALLLVVFYFVKGEGARAAARVCFSLAVLLVVASSMYFMVAYDASNSLHVSLNSILSGRFRLAHGYYSLQPLTLLGSTFEGLTTIYWENGEPKTFVVDNAWCHLILRFGVLPATMFLVGYLVFFFKMIRERRWDALLFGFVLMAAYGFSENFGIRVECNYFLYAIGAELLFSSQVGKELSGARKPRRLNKAKVAA